MFVQNLLPQLSTRFNGAGDIVRWADFALFRSKTIDNEKITIKKYQFLVLLSYSFSLLSSNMSEPYQLYLK